jgi:hypothetical protein
MDFQVEFNNCRVFNWPHSLSGWISADETPTPGFQTNRRRSFEAKEGVTIKLLPTESTAAMPVHVNHAAYYIGSLWDVWCC